MGFQCTENRGLVGRIVSESGKLFPLLSTLEMVLFRGVCLWLLARTGINHSCYCYTQGGHKLHFF